MLYYSLNRDSQQVDFTEAMLTSLAPDKGLYFPTTIPTFSKKEIEAFRTCPLEELGYNILRPFIGSAIDTNALKEIAAQAFNFSMPIKWLDDESGVIELFHGNTLAFKDAGARFMSRCLGYAVRNQSRPITVLVATSGDTGGAVADGFWGVPGIEVVILFPKGKVSKVQEKQLTTRGKNIHAISVAGNFDDCQRLVKQAFADHQLRSRLFLTSANSINVARWLPQQLFYWSVFQQWNHKDVLPVFVVPSGNFGNICAGMLAHKTGLPARHFIAACNANDTVPRYLQTGKYEVHATVSTISNAMDVSDPSNFIRILEMYKDNPLQLQDIFSSFKITETETREAIQKIYAAYNYTIDPHTAVGWAALEKFRNEKKSIPSCILSTAHPVKFYDTIENILHQPVQIHKSIQDFLESSGTALEMTPDYVLLTDFLTSLS